MVAHSSQLKETLLQVVGVGIYKMCEAWFSISTLRTCAFWFHLEYTLSGLTGGTNVI